MLSVLSQPKRTALLTYLAVASPRGFHRRDKLLGLFWPDLDQDRGRAALRKALHHLRRSLGETTILSRGDEEVGLNWEGLRSDVADLEAAMQGGRAARAVEIFTGDLLEGFFLPGCPEFERWLQIERDSLRSAVARAGWEAAFDMVTSGRVTEGVTAAQRALELIPTNETQVRAFLTALAAAGDRPAAVQFYQKFADHLRETIDLDPSEETRALLASIRTQASSTGQKGPIPRLQSYAMGERGPSVGRRESPPPAGLGPERGEGFPEPGVRGPPTRDRHIVEWGAAYIAGGWALVQSISFLDGTFGWPQGVRLTLTIAAVFGILLAMVLAWYHGRGASKKISGPELLMVALLLLVLGIALSLIHR